MRLGLDTQKALTTPNRVAASQVPAPRTSSPRRQTFVRA